jgi:dephospho-CoA kinase
MPSTPRQRDVGAATDRCCAVGLTGGLASGKSTVARILADRGVAVLDADRIVHDLYQPGEAGTIVVAELFGLEMIAADRSVDRARLGQTVLGDATARRRLEAAVHPLVRARVAEWLAARPSDSIAVVEAALLVETGSWRDYDFLVVAMCSAEQQLERALARGVSDRRARALLAAQLPLESKRSYADVVIDNRGDLEALLTEVERAWRATVSLCAGRHSAAGSSQSVS